MRNILILSVIAIAAITWGGDSIRDRLEYKVSSMAAQRTAQLNRLEVLQMGRHDYVQPASPRHEPDTSLEEFHMRNGNL